jgi:hypothetical protein
MQGNGSDVDVHAWHLNAGEIELMLAHTIHDLSIGSFFQLRP